MKKYKQREITEKIIGAAYKVHNTFGSGFLEKVYQNSLVIELRTQGFSVEVEKPIMSIIVTKSLVIMLPILSLMGKSFSKLKP